MPRSLRILGVHGVGGHAPQGEWTRQWTAAIEGSLAAVSADVIPVVDFVSYDDLFDAEEITALGTLEAIGKLSGSAIASGLEDLFGVRRERGARGISEMVRWTAGMVVQWVENEGLRRSTRARLAEQVVRFDPQVICAHSLGSLIAYDTFAHPDHRGLVAQRTFVSLGSQIGNAFVRGQFGGRIAGLDCRFWYHLYNDGDSVFTAPLRIPGASFLQVGTHFDLPGDLLDHEATAYLSHSAAVAEVWNDLAAPARVARTSRAARTQVRRGGEHGRRALLVGINDYPAEEDRLAGCVNDVFLMSALLQERGFAPDEIRVVLDERATARGIRERLEWLLDGAGPRDERVFFYSGHGARITGYGVDEIVDRKDECLVPYDFDWTRDNAITDDWFHDLYSQLPYDTQFLVILDCCHSGGMTRAGARARGIDPPDDIRHRELEWDADLGMWRDRRPPPPNKSLAEGRRGRDYLGASGVVRRFARGTDLMPLSNRAYDARRKRYGHHGPFLPVILQACQESEYAYEYRHGVASYGAFTYSLGQELRETSRRGQSFVTLTKRITARLKELKYDQVPNLVGPSRVVRGRVPWAGR